MTATTEAAIYTTALAAVAVIWLICHLTDRADYWRTEALAAERDLRARQRCPAPQPHWQPQPAPVDLAAWDREVDGLPWAHAANWTRPIQVRTETDTDGAVVHRIVPERPSTAMIRRIVSEAA